MQNIHAQDKLPLPGGPRLYYETEGRGEPLVFLNGILMSVDGWKVQRRYFRNHFRCICHDFRDQLRSDPSPAPYDMSVHAGDLRALLDHLQIDRAHLVGTSYGGEVGMVFAAQYPERVRSLTVIASVAHPNELLKQQVENWRETALRTPADLYQSVAALSFSEPFLRKHPAFIQQSAERMAQLPPAFFRGFARLCDAFLLMDIRDQLPRIACPTLLVTAELDRLKRPEYREQLAAIPNARWAIIPGAGHAVVLERGREVKKLVASFLRNLGKG